MKKQTKTSAASNKEATAPVTNPLVTDNVESSNPLTDNTLTEVINNEEGTRVVFSSRGTVTTPSFSILEDGRLHVGTLPLGSFIPDSEYVRPDAKFFAGLFSLPDRNYDRNFFNKVDEVIPTTEEEPSAETNS